MMSYNVHTSVNLGYGFPSGENSGSAVTIFKDSALLKNLKVHDEPLPQDALYLKKPIGKVFNIDSENIDPIENLLLENKALNNEFKLELPFTRETVVKAKRVLKPGKKSISNTKRSRKRTFITEDIDEAEVSYAMEEGDYDHSSIYNTSIPNKNIFFSPALKKKASQVLQSTPVSMLKEAHQRSSKKLLKMDKASVVVSKEVAKVAETTADDSDFDPLACHANNIMRLAVDSTMMGSSFSLSFSSTFANDSVLQSKKKYPDFFTNDDNESDRSVIEGLKSKRSRKNLMTSRANKIEINAADLQAAVRD